MNPADEIEHHARVSTVVAGSTLHRTTHPDLAAAMVRIRAAAEAEQHERQVREDWMRFLVARGVLKEAA